MIREYSHQNIHARVQAKIAHAHEGASNYIYVVPHILMSSRRKNEICAVVVDSTFAKPLDILRSTVHTENTLIFPRMQLTTPFYFCFSKTN